MAQQRGAKRPALPHDARPALAAALGVELSEPLLTQALTHRSYAYEHGGLPHNERLEFLGDAVLGLVVTTTLYIDYPERSEGELAKLRASVVNMRALAQVARGLGPEGLGRYLLLGKGEEATGGRAKVSILADTTEALLGAVHVEHGLEVASGVVHRLFDPRIEDVALRGAGHDWKTTLQELASARGVGAPEYRILSSGPDHARHFVATAVLAGEPLGTGEGPSKKEAEQLAAEEACRTLTKQDDGA
jgi:ribonuclease-3